jgi:hypothetical protein
MATSACPRLHASSLSLPLPPPPHPPLPLPLPPPLALPLAAALQAVNIVKVLQALDQIRDLLKV